MNIAWTPSLKVSELTGVVRRSQKKDPPNGVTPIYKYNLSTIVDKVAFILTEKKNYRIPDFKVITSELNMSMFGLTPHSRVHIKFYGVLKTISLMRQPAMWWAETWGAQGKATIIRRLLKNIQQ